MLVNSAQQDSMRVGAMAHQVFMKITTTDTAPRRFDLDLPLTALGLLYVFIPEIFFAMESHRFHLFAGGWRGLIHDLVITVLGRSRHVGGVASSFWGGFDSERSGDGRGDG